MARLLTLSFVCLGFLVGCGEEKITVTAPEKFSEPGQLEVLGGAGDASSGATAPKLKQPPQK